MSVGQGDGFRCALPILRVAYARLPVVARPHRAVLDLHRELRHRCVGRRAQGAPVADIEFRAVQGAFDRRVATVEVARGQFEILVAAAVLERVEVAVDVEPEDRRVDVPGHRGFAGQPFGGGPDADPVGPGGAPRRLRALWERTYGALGE